MTAKTFLTISSIFAILYGLSFMLAPGQSIAMYGTEPEAHLTLICRFLGSALLAFGVVQWFSKEFRDWDAVRAVLIAIAVLNAVRFAGQSLGHVAGPVQCDGVVDHDRQSYFPGRRALLSFGWGKEIGVRRQSGAREANLMAAAPAPASQPADRPRPSRRSPPDTRRHSRSLTRARAWPRSRTSSNP